MTHPVELEIEGMHCAACVARVEKALGAVQGVESATANLATERARVQLTGGVPTAELVSAVEATGFAARPARGREGLQELARAQQRRESALTRRAAISLLLAALVMALSMGVGGIQAPGRMVALLSGLVVFVGGRDFFSGALQQLRHRSSDMNTLVALGSLTAWTWSVVALEFQAAFRAQGMQADYWFDGAAMIVAFLLVGRALEARARRRAGDALRGLLTLGAPTARRLRSDGSEQEIRSEDLLVADRVVVRPGEIVPVDGKIVEGRAAVDESMFTGESVPVSRDVGDTVHAATRNVDGRLVIEALAVGADTAVARIVELVESAQASKSSTQQRVDRIASVFVPVVLGIAALTFTVWAFVPGAGLPFAIERFVTVLIIACPCAMGLATPAALLVGTGRGAERGILFADPGALEGISELDVVLLDKTGTMTSGEPEVTDHGSIDRASDAEELMAGAAAVEAGSEHPLGRAIAGWASVSQAAGAPVVENFRSVAGRGVQGMINGALWQIGSPGWMLELGIDIDALAHTVGDQERRGRTTLIVAIDGVARGWISLADRPREGAAEVVAALHARGIRTVLLTGDRQEVAVAVASELGIESVEAECLPEDKARHIMALREAGARVAMVGDGINDAIALAEADLGIAFASGADVAREAASITLMRNDPQDLVTALDLGQRTARTIRQNLTWAFLYNGLGIPVAAGAFIGLGVTVSPVFGAAAMAMSSVSVLLNSLRLRR